MNSKIRHTNCKLPSYLFGDKKVGHHTRTDGNAVNLRFSICVLQPLPFLHFAVKATRVQPLYNKDSITFMKV
jgi:hypothetical protein